VETLRVERDGWFLRVTLSRPERRNAFDETLITELATAFADVGDARAVVLAAEGPSFCAGADVDWMRASAGLGPDENLAGARRLGAMFAAIDGCPAPVVARVHGHALGGGAGLVSCADVALAEPETVFGFAEVKLGLVPAVISPFVLAKIGPSAARRYFVTGERFGAEEALRIGLVHELAPDLDTALGRVLDELLDAGPQAARAAKELARTPLSPGETAAAIAERRAGDEGQEGLHAFLEGRSPAWRPR
jgi:methylglutaconyl-CoA hydratase